MDKMNEEELRQYAEMLVRNATRDIVNESVASINENLKKEITDKLSTDKLINKVMNKLNIKMTANNIQITMTKYLDDLKEIKKFREDIRNEILSSLDSEKERIITEINNERPKLVQSEIDEIKNIASDAYMLADFIENVKNRVVNDIVMEATKRIAEEKPSPRTIEIFINNNSELNLEEDLYHKEFENIYKLVRIGLPVMLIGPTGSGKSVCASQVAKALGLNMYYTNNASEEYKLLGFTDAYGKFKETQFYKAFKNGGLFFLDEIDNSHPSALLSLNSAIGATSGKIYMAFEDGNYTEAHPDFRIIAAANTWGTGANRMYCGRNELDSASLDRFIQVYFDYDKKLERAIVNDEELLQFFWDYRRIIDDCGIRHTVTTRNIDYAVKLKNAGFSTEQILLYTIIKELDFEDMKIIFERFKNEGVNETIYLKEFKKMLIKRS